MPKLAIYVPKKEMKLVEKWRKRLNFSQIFMKALQREIASQSTPGSADPLATAAAFYAESAPEDTVRTEGRQLAIQHLLKCRLDKQEVQELLKLSQRKDVSQQQIDIVLQHSGNTAKRTKLLKKHGFTGDTAHEGERHFAEGYLGGIQETWTEISKRM